MPGEAVSGEVSCRKHCAVEPPKRGSPGGRLPLPAPKGTGAGIQPEAARRVSPAPLLGQLSTAPTGRGRIFKGPNSVFASSRCRVVCGAEATVSRLPFLNIWKASGRQAVIPPISEWLGKVTFKEAKAFVLDGNSRFLNII